MKRTGDDMVRVLPRLMLAAVVILLRPAATGALAATNEAFPYSVRIWQTDDGLPQNSVYAITQTAYGYLWVGTHEGLARFDGVRFTITDEKAAPELKHGWITALRAGRDGSLWIAADGKGVTRLKNGTYSHFSEINGLPSNQTRCLLEGNDGSIWIGSEGGLARYNDAKLKSFTKKSGLADNSVRAICEDQQGIIRIATRRGLSGLDKDENISTINFGLGTIANALKSVCEDRQGNIWVSSNEGVTTPTEKMQLELERLLKENPELENHLDGLPGRVFSGKAHHKASGAQAVFFCYNLPAEDAASHEWTDAAGRTSWYLFDFTMSKILDQPEEIHAFIKCQPDTPRRVEMTAEALRTVRLKIEGHIKNTYLKQMQAPVGVKPTLKCWMELN